MTDQKPSQDMRSFVRQRYGQIAKDSLANSQVSCGCSSSQSGCCSTSADEVISVASIEAGIYQPSDLEGLPEDVASFSLGCGDPITLAELKPDQTVLDLGSGGGLDCFLAARKVGPTGKVIGVDMTAEMIEKARANREKVGLNNVEFRLGEIEHLPVADESVDVIISNCVINLSPDKTEVFREAFRALKPGGRLAVSDIVTNGPLPEAVKSSLSAWAGCVAGALDVGEYKAAIESAGFIEVKVQPEYFTKETVDQAIGQLDIEPDPAWFAEERIYQSVFSARVSAIKPG